MSSEFEGLRTDVIGRESSLRVAGVELIVVAGPDRGAKLKVQGNARIGTSPTSQLRLTDKTVSRLHVEIQVRANSVRVVDSGSTNGTFLDGVRVRDADIALGTTMKLGATSIRVELGEGDVHLPLSTLDRFGGIIGSSVEMRRVYSVLERVAPSDATVLVQGETGTGKELVARALHDASKRADGPFIAIDCGALAPTLIESELFGHVRGAFSGANVDRRGVFEEADGGTLFFDEIGELPIALQPKLLRALEMREVRRLGSNTPKKVDVRVIAATNRSLASNVNEGAFREDLYYRLAVVEVMLPPLRARREDIALLARHFYQRFAGSDAIPADLVSTVQARSWPGNVRELRNFMERSASLGWATRAVSPAATPDETRIAEQIDLGVPFKVARRTWTRAYVAALMQSTSSNVTRAADVAGVSRRFLQRLIARLERPGTPDDDPDE
jgi:transcriptional regulator with PAS, ATPase and Fis domain